MARDLGYTGAIEADTGLNIFNGFALQVWEDLHMSSVAPSLELTFGATRKLTKVLLICH